jgi:hypothetical protein
MNPEAMIWRRILSWIVSCAWNDEEGKEVTCLGIGRWGEVGKGDIGDGGNLSTELLDLLHGLQSEEMLVAERGSWVVFVRSDSGKHLEQIAYASS